MPDQATGFAADAAGLDPAAVVIAVVVPAYRQAGLLPEAIAAALGQRGAPPLAVVVVDDGCPSPSTAAVAAQYAAACPGRVYLLRQRNRGLSGARNTGIDFALAAFPACRGIFFLDADNRLHPPFLARAFAALAAAPPTTGWFYADIDKFGDHEECANGGEFSLLQLLVQNYCEAGSLVRREVFEAGLRFDTETMRLGFEDWDFWLQAAARGFRGQHLPEAGFLYRRRPESMLSSAERQRDHLLSLLRLRHAALLSPASILALEAAEAPRYALFEAGRPEVRVFLDPARPTEGFDPPAFRRRLLRARHNPGAVHAPAVCLFADAGALDPLRRHGVLPMLLWWAERLLRDNAVVAIEIAGTTAPELALEVWETTQGETTQGETTQGETMQAGAAEAAILAIAGSRLADYAAAPASPEIDTLADLDPVARLGRLRITLPSAVPRFGGAALRLLQGELAMLRRLDEAGAGLPKPWRLDWRSPRSGIAGEARWPLGLGVTIPRLPEAGRRDIGFVIPVFSVGGVEKVLLAQARVLRAQGWRTHLVVAGSLAIACGPDLAESFDSVTLFARIGEETVDWDAGYFGTGISSFDQGAGARDALGTLIGCDVVVNIHALACQPLMAALRRQGIRTLGALHLVERDAWGQPKGNPHMQVAYEHVYDGVLVISDQLRDWCIGQGLPRDKLTLVRNAPGYPTPLARIAQALADRATRAGPLNILFIGRLDAQKGTDRLAAIIAATRGPAMAWRVVGREVLQDGARPLIGLAVEPPVQAPAALDALYAWADVLVLPSRFEGVPLVILEAQRLGCTVVATDVGAVREIVADGEDGILIPAGDPEEVIILGVIDTLRRLAADRGALRAIGTRAAARVGAADWPVCMQAMLARLDALVPPTLVPPTLVPPTLAPPTLVPPEKTP